MAEVAMTSPAGASPAAGGYTQLDGKTPEELKSVRLFAGVNYGVRTVKDTPCAIFGFLALLVNFVLAIALIASAKSASQMDEMLEAAGCPTFIASIEGPAGIGVLLEQHIGPFIGSIVLGMFMCLIWVFTLRFKAQTAVWGTLIFKVVVTIGVSAYFFSVEYMPVHLPIGGLLYATYAIIMMFVMKNRINTAAEIMRTAMKGVIANPMLLVTAFIMQAVLLGYQLLTVVSVIFSFTVVEVFPDSCILVAQSWVGTTRSITLFLFMFTVSVVEASRLYVVAVSMGDWYFKETSMADPGRKSPIAQGLKWAFTTSFGTITVGSCIMVIGKWAKREAEKGFCRSLCSFGGCFLWCIAYILNKILKALSSLLIILAALSGGNTMQCAKMGWGLAQRHLVNGAVNNQVGETVLETGALICSAVLGLFCWLVVAAAEKVGPFDSITAVQSWFVSVMGESAGPVIFGLFMYVYLWFIAWCLNKKLVGMVIFTMFPQVLLFVFGNSGTMGVFVMLLGRFLFSFMAGFLLNSVDSTFVCFAIDQDNGGKNPNTADIGPYVEALAKDAMNDSGNPFKKATPPPEGYHNGTYVTVHGLESPEAQPYNNTAGVIQQFHPADTSFTVLMQLDLKTFVLKQSNITPSAPLYVHAQPAATDAAPVANPAVPVGTTAEYPTPTAPQV